MLCKMKRGNTNGKLGEIFKLSLIAVFGFLEL